MRSISRDGQRDPYDMRMLLHVPIVAFALLTLGGQGELERQYGAWKAEAAPLTYRGTELYTFMDGGAEIYFEYGFEQVQSQSYRRGSDEMAVELYRMRAGAYGLFTFLRSAEAEKIPVGDAAFLAGYYLVFVKGPFLCAVTAQSAFAGSREALLEMAGSIASQLDGAATPPEVLSLLPVEKRDASTEKQLRGPIGLRNTAPQAADLFSGFSDGAAATYGPGSVAGLLTWPDPAQADHAWKRAVDRADGGCTRNSSGFDAPLSCAGGAAHFGAARVGSFVVFASGTDRQGVEGLIVRLKSSVAGEQSIPRREKEHD